MTDTIYTNSSNRTVTLDVPVRPNDAVEITVSDSGQEVFEVTLTDLSSSDPISFDLPFSLTRHDRSLEVHWLFTYTENGETYEFSEYHDVDVVTPILPFKEITKIVGPDATESELVDIERAVRYIIQAHTGQSFGKFVGKKTVSGSGESSLRLPARLNSIKSINSLTYWHSTIAIRGNGWFLVSKDMDVPGIKDDYEGWHRHPNTGVISAPHKAHKFAFVKHNEFEIDGVWGWATVPDAVQEAAKLLINDYACGESMYRDRFIQSMQTSDWRIQFNDGAYTNTGNVRANQLLAEFTLKRGWMVI